jgi:arsenite methyltransferase
VFQEAWRVLKPGGRLEIDDMVTDLPLPMDFLEDPAGWAGCIAGALTEQEYLQLVRQAGFSEITTRRSRSGGEIDGVQIYSMAVSAKK